ncbi:hypothetical protein ACFY5K_27220 [Streptomyces griseofuscus]|nr:hypothetical protein [Streptomyces sp. CRPSP2-6A1]
MSADGILERGPTRSGNQGGRRPAGTSDAVRTASGTLCSAIG